MVFTTSPGPAFPWIGGEHSPLKSPGQPPSYVGEAHQLYINNLKKNSQHLNLIEGMFGNLQVIFNNLPLFFQTSHFDIMASCKAPHTPRFFFWICGALNFRVLVDGLSTLSQPCCSLEHIMLPRLGVALWQRSVLLKCMDFMHAFFANQIMHPK